MAIEVAGPLSGRTNFKNIYWREFFDTASPCAESAFYSWGNSESRTTRRVNSIGGFREGWRNAQKLFLVVDVFGRYGNEKPRSAGPGTKQEILPDDVTIPRRTPRRSVNLISLPGFLVPDQDMDNVSTKSTAAAANKDPFFPFACLVSPYT